MSFRMRESYIFRQAFKVCVYADDSVLVHAVRKEVGVTYGPFGNEIEALTYIEGELIRASADRFDDYPVETDGVGYKDMPIPGVPF